ncbi:hypothetical protein PENTCL1PPCAC_5872, partial [Pristionchus entomophagus]
PMTMGRAMRARDRTSSEESLRNRSRRAVRSATPLRPNTDGMRLRVSRAINLFSSVARFFRMKSASSRHSCTFPAIRFATVESISVSSFLIHSSSKLPERTVMRSARNWLSSPIPHVGRTSLAQSRQKQLWRRVSERRRSSSDDSGHLKRLKSVLIFITMGIAVNYSSASSLSASSSPYITVSRTRILSTSAGICEYSPSKRMSRIR